jgi:acyl-coenzyme A thioesterase PaaI-like protein
MTPAELQAAGWTAREYEGFTGELGSIWVSGTGVDRAVGFFVEERHTNNHLGTCHGGALMTFADVALGFGVVDALGAVNCATAQLQTYFVSAAKVGEFVSCRPELVRRTAQLIFIRGLVCVGDKTVASADGIWKVLEQKSKA